MNQKHYSSFTSCKCAAYRLYKHTGKTVYIVETFWGWSAVTEIDKSDKIVYTIHALKEA